MELLALFFSASGRVAPKPFAFGAAVVYAIACLSLLLISPLVTLHAGAALFALVQAIAIWAWLCLHAKRLRDAGRNIAPAIAIAILYALAMVLLVLILALSGEMAFGDATQTPGRGGDPLSSLLAIWSGDPGLFAYVIAGIFGVIFAPMLIAMGFSIWAGTRRRAAAATAR